MKRNANHNHKKTNYFPGKTGQWIAGIALIVVALVLALGFFGLAGMLGNWFAAILYASIGKTALALPVVLLLSGAVCFLNKQEKFFAPLILGIILFLAGLSGLLANFDLTGRVGGQIGYYLALPLFNLFGFYVAMIFFFATIVAATLVFWWLLGRPLPDLSGFKLKTGPIKEKKKPAVVTIKKPSLTKTFNGNKNGTKPIIMLPKFNGLGKNSVQSLEKSETSTRQKSVAIRNALISQVQYKIPPLDLLDKRDSAPLAGDVNQNSAIIKKTLENFGIPVEMSPEIIVGPSVTQYALKPAEGIKLSKITALSNDLSLALASFSIRIEAPIPGKSLVGVEVPNKSRAGVGLRDLISTPQFTQASSYLQIALGKDILGNPIYADLAKMPHLMVAGATGTGKTIFINSVLTALLYRNPPEMLRLVLVDPKRVEMRGYNNLPHLLTPVIFDVQKTIAALKWAIGEMDRRFDLLSEKESRNINSYNEKCAREGCEHLPYIVFVIDELADLMASKGKEIEAGIVRLAQMARAVGIHLIVATQRPSVEIITGLIKANIICRVAFQVASQVDSRTILDMAGAEKLLGSGDMLYMSAQYPKPKRIQGPYISEKESKRILDWIKNNNPQPEFKIDEAILENLMIGEIGREYNGSGSMFNVADLTAEGFGDDPLYEQAKTVVIQARKASASFLQRRLRVGYARAARLIDLLEERGVVGPGEGAKPRDVLVSGLEGTNGANGADLDETQDETQEDDGWQKA